MKTYIYRENESLLHPINTSLSQNSSGLLNVKEALRAHGFAGDRLPLNQIGFLVSGECTVLIISKSISIIEHTEHLLPCLRANSSLMSFFEVLSSFRNRITELGVSWTGTQCEVSEKHDLSILDDEILQHSKRVTLFLEEFGRSSYEVAREDLSAIRGNIQFTEQIKRRGDALVPINCEFPITNDSHVLYQYIHLALADLSSCFRKTQRTDSIFHYQISQGLKKAFEFVAHAPPEQEENQLLLEVEDYLERPEFAPWKSIISEIRSFRNRFRALEGGSVFYNHLIQMDKLFEDVVHELLLRTGDPIIRKGMNGIRVQEENSSALLGGSKWISVDGKYIDDLSDDSNPDLKSGYKTIPDACFHIRTPAETELRLLADFKYKSLRVSQKGPALVGFDRADRYQLLAFVLSEIIGSPNSEVPRRLVVFYSGRERQWNGDKVVPFVLEFDSCFYFPFGINALNMVQEVNGEALRIFLIPIDMNSAIDQTKVQSELVALRQCLEAIC